MTISTKPDDIDNPEVLLYYMESHPHSGENRAAAKLLRKLLAIPTPSKLDEMLDSYRNGDREFPTYDELMAIAAPLAAVSDNDISKLAHSVLGDCYVGKDAEEKLARTILAGQVAPQATVEPKPDAYLIPMLLTFKNAVRTSAPVELQDEVEGTVGWLASLHHDDESVIDKHGVTHTVRALFATPPTSKATEDEIVYQVTAPDGLHGWSDVTKQQYEKAQSNGYECRIVYLEATSKADTGEIRDALDKGLDAAIVICELLNEQTEVGDAFDMAIAAIRALKSATPSTIKEEPTGEQL